jgi:hypothetical protein
VHGFLVCPVYSFTLDKHKVIFTTVTYMFPLQIKSAYGTSGSQNVKKDLELNVQYLVILVLIFITGGAIEI